MDARGRDAAARRHPDAGAARPRLPAPALRRHAPARDDRDGARCNPKLLIADEPTTALDVTIQAQILELMNELRERLGMAILLITHDLGVVAEMVDEVAVMYAGRVVERGPVADVFASPQHPYTEALLRSIPLLGMRTRAAAGDPRQRPEPAQLAAGLPLRAALRLRLRPAAWTRTRRSCPAAAGVGVLALRERPRASRGAPRRSHERRAEHDAAISARPAPTDVLARGARREEVLPGRKGVLMRDGRPDPGRRRRRPRRPPRRDARARRRVRLRQVDARPDAAAPARADRGRDRVRGRRHHRASARAT